MRKLMILLYMLPIFVFGQSKKTLTLQLSTGDCRKNDNLRVGYNDTIRFFQNENLIKQIIPVSYSEWPIAIDSFESGTYTVVYRNLYERQVSKLITIPDSSEEYELQICPDELLNYPVNSLLALKNNDIIKIAYSSFGCFHNYDRTLSIKKQNSVFVAKFTVGSKVKSVTLTQPMIDAFKRFENEIRVLEDTHNCTTTDEYTITSKNWTIKRTDGSCAWDGFYFLEKALFGKTQ